MSTVQIETPVARKGRTSASRVSKTMDASRSSTNPRKGAGGHSSRDTHTSIAASKVALRGGKAKGTPATVAAMPSHNSRASGASGQSQRDAQVACATRKVARKSRTAANNALETTSGPPQSTNSAAPTKSSRAGKSASKNKPRALNEAKPMDGLRAAPLSDGQKIYDPLADIAVAPLSALPVSHDAHYKVERATSQASWPMPAEQRDTIVALYGNWRRRQALVKAMTKLSLQAQATLRFGRDREEAAKHYAVVSKNPDHDDYIDIVPYLDAMQALEKYRTSHEKELVRLVKVLPIYGWAKTVSGLGDVSLAGLVGECSGLNVETNEWWSIGQMKSPSAMRKRLGLAVMSGIRQGDATAGLTKVDWVEHGYVKTRRSVVWNVGECIVKAQWRKENTVHAYGKFYGEEKARLQALNEAGEYAEQAARIVERMKKAGSKPLAENLAGRLTAGHINNRAKRHMTKRLIRDLWLAWRAADRKAMGLPPDGYAPVAEAA